MCKYCLKDRTGQGTETEPTEQVSFLMAMIRQIYRARSTTVSVIGSINYEMDFWGEITSGRSFKKAVTINLNNPMIPLKFNADLTVH